MTGATAPDVAERSESRDFGLLRLFGSVLLIGAVFDALSYICMPSFLLGILAACGAATGLCIMLWTKSGARIAGLFFTGLVLIYLLNRFFNGLDDLFSNPPFWCHID